MPPRVLKNVVPIRDFQGSHKSLIDVSIDEEGRIVAVGPDLAAPPGAQIVDARGAYLSAGWIDSHTHIYYGATDISLRPQQAGMKTGVTTIVDAGSSGEANFEGFKEYIVGRGPEDIFAFLNLGSIGLVACNRVPELTSIASIDIDRTLAVARAHPGIIKGIKVSASHVITGSWGITPLLLGTKVARILKLPLMVHVGEPPPLLDEVLAVLDPGDIMTHCFNGKNGGNILDDSFVLDLARKSYDRGILFDIGHGSASFSFRIARQAIDLGLAPHIISTDLHGHDIDGPVWDLATTMSKILSLGITLEEVVKAVTERPSIAIGIDPAPTDWLKVGRRANFTVFETARGAVSVSDSMGEVQEIDKLILPRWAVLGPHLTSARAKTEDLLGAGRP